MTLPQKISITLIFLCAIGIAAAVVFATVSADNPDRNPECVDSNGNDMVDINELFDVIDAYFNGTSCLPSTSEPGPTPPALSDMISHVRPAVVKILTPSGGQGSGVIFKLDDDYSYILTNQHVTRHDETVSIIVEDGAQYTGTVLGVDVRRDLAVVRIDCPRCTHLEFGDSDTLNIGDEVVALGYPMDRLMPTTMNSQPSRTIRPSSMTVTTGVVSAFRYDTERDRELIQTDAPISQGNSGGPLVSLNGEIIGINTESIVAGIDPQNLNFAVLETTVQEQLPTLLKGTSIPEPTPPLERRLVHVLGPVLGHMHHDDDTRYETAQWTIYLEDVLTEAWFENPYAHTDDTQFSYGFRLRLQPGEPFLIFVVSSLNSSWALVERDGSDSRLIASGTSPTLRTGEGQRNFLVIALADKYAAMSVNGELLTSSSGFNVFDVGTNTGRGAVAAITGYYADTEIPWSITHFSDLYISAFTGTDVRTALQEHQRTADGSSDTYRSASADQDSDQQSVLQP